MRVLSHSPEVSPRDADVDGSAIRKGAHLFGDLKPERTHVRRSLHYPAGAPGRQSPHPRSWSLPSSRP
jgi:hypothetical protein